MRGARGKGEGLFRYRDVDKDGGARGCGRRIVLRAMFPSIRLNEQERRKCDGIVRVCYCDYTTHAYVQAAFVSTIWIFLHLFNLPPIHFPGLVVVWISSICRSQSSSHRPSVPIDPACFSPSSLFHIRNHANLPSKTAKRSSKPKRLHPMRSYTFMVKTPSMHRSTVQRVLPPPSHQ